MSNYVSTAYTPDDSFLEGKVEVDETLSVEVAGTAATITDTTSYAVTDQDGLAMTITMLHNDRPALNLGAQTVTFPASTTTALLVAAAINDQAKQLSATVTGGQVVITSDNVGSGVTISVAVGDTNLTWDTPVAGTGSYAGVEIVPGMLLARTTSSTSPFTAGDIVPYDSGNNPAGANAIKGMADFTATFTASGSKVVKMAIAGKVVEGKINKVGGTVTQAEKDSLVINTSIVYASVLNGIDSQV